MGKKFRSTSRRISQIDWFDLGLVLLILLCRCLCVSSASEQHSASKSTASHQQKDVDSVAQSQQSDTTKGAGPVSSSTCVDEYSCLSASLSDNERRLALEAIRTLHGQLDDDANGNIDLSESDEFLREELKYENGYEKRQRAFHRDDDMHISVRELWDIWIRSEVHNWTTQQTVDWLVHLVQLPQYSAAFTQQNIDGSKLPRLAVNNQQYFLSVLGVKDPIHRQKIAVKAMDVVLFGPPKDGRNHFKDATLMTLLAVALAGCWYTYRTNKRSKQHLTKLMEHMEILSSAEKELQELQIKLQHARQEQDITLSQKEQLERQLQEETRVLRDSSLANLTQQQNQQLDPHAEEEIRRLREEVDILRAELQRAEGELDDRICWAPPPELQHWLQLTYEVEQRAYNKKRLQAEKQLEQAKDACEKLNRKRSSFVASFVSTHGRTIDDVDRSILEARSSLMEVKQDLQERMMRWRQIESLCGFPITTNPGYNYLETLLRSGLNSSRYVVLNSTTRPQGMQQLDDDGDDTCSVVSSSAAVQHLVSTSALVFLTSAAGIPAAAAAVLPHLQQQQEARYRMQQLHHQHHQQQSCVHPKRFLLKRDSNISLESTSSSNGIGSSQSIASMMDRPRTSSRQRLNQRENSKDSAIEGSIISSVSNGGDDDSVDIKYNGISGSISSVRSSIPITVSTAAAAATTPATAAKSTFPTNSKTESNMHKSNSMTAPVALDKVANLSSGYETGRKSPMLSKAGAHQQRSHQMSKTPSQDSAEFKPSLRKMSQSESALDVCPSFQLGMKCDNESGQEEGALSTDSSIPSVDGDPLTIKRTKKKRFNFPNFVRRSTRK